MTMQKTPKLLMGFESSLGAGATVGKVLSYLSFDPGVSKSKGTSQVIGSDLNPRKPFNELKDAAPTLEVPVDTRQMGYFLKALFGAPSTTDEGGGNYTHEFKIDSDSLPSVQFEHVYDEFDPDEFGHVLGCKADSMSITAGVSGELSASFSFMGTKGLLSNASFDSDASNAAYNKLQHQDAALTLDGSSSTDLLQSLTLNVNRNLDGDTHTIGGGGVRGAIGEQICSVGGSFSMLFKNTDYIDKGFNDTEASIKIRWTATNDEYMEIELQELQYSEALPPVNGPQGMRVGHDFQAYYDDGSETSAVVVRLNNNIASY